MSENEITHGKIITYGKIIIDVKADKDDINGAGEGVLFCSFDALLESVNDLINEQQKHYKMFTITVSDE